MWGPNSKNPVLEQLLVSTITHDSCNHRIECGKVAERVNNSYYDTLKPHVSGEIATASRETSLLFRHSLCQECQAI